MAYRDLNMDIAGQLYDMALIHASPHGRIAYKRAAQAVARLDEPMDEIIAARTLRAYADIALAHARIAKIPPARILNTWPAAKLLDWAKRKRSRRR